jgi:hypothetical protein
MRLKLDGCMVNLVYRDGSFDALEAAQNLILNGTEWN